jgi:hypothetical protein
VQPVRVVLLMRVVVLVLLMHPPSRQRGWASLERPTE